METFGCPGFRTAGVCAGLKKNGANDLGLIFAEGGATVAGAYTRNRVQAAPVGLTRRRASAGRWRAVVVNSKNANCCTGPRGMTDAETVTARVAEALGVPAEQVLAASTGVIGTPMPTAILTAAVPALVASLAPGDVKFGGLPRA